MKRKEYQDKYDNFSHFNLSSPSAKTRRLDPESFFDELQVPRNLQEDRQQLATSNDEKALVLYNPANTPFFRSPTITDFSVVVNSDLIPGLKDHFISLEKSKTVSKERTNYGSDNSLAIVPWVATRTGATSPPEPEEAEMMDVETDTSVPIDLDSESQHWQQQQHCLRPELLSATYTPVAW